MFACPDLEPWGCLSDHKLEQQRHTSKVHHILPKIQMQIKLISIENYKMECQRIIGT